MAFTRPTLRRNGKRAITVRVQFHLDADHVAGILGRRYLAFGDHDLTRAQADEAVRNHLHLYGTDHQGLSDAAFPDEIDATRAYARRQIERLFPDMLSDLSEEF